MPFTLAHPAAVLPLRRMPLMRTVPLIIGALSPDVTYYLPWRIAKHIPQISHTTFGLFVFDLPVSLLLLVLVWLLRAPLAAPLGPATHARFCSALQRFGSRPVNWALAPLSILVGAWTHLAWDSATHADGWTVLRVPALSAPVHFFSYTGELCHVLQYASSVFGLVVLAIWLARLPPEPAAEIGNGERAAGGPRLLAGLCLAAAAAGGLETLEHFEWHIPPNYYFFYLLITRTTAWFALLYTVAGLVIVRGRRRTAAAASLT